MRLLLILVLLLVLWSSCESSDPLVGHWHIKTSASARSGTFETLDIDADSIILNQHRAPFGDAWFYFYNHLYRDIYHNRFARREFEYELNGDTLFFWVQFKSADTLTLVGQGLKCTENCDHFEEDYFSGSIVDLQLPIADTADVVGEEGLEEYSLCNFILIGSPKEEWQNVYGKEHRLELGESFGTIDDIPLFVEKHKVKIPENKRHRIVSIIYADKDCPSSLMEATLTMLRKTGVQKVFRVYKSNPGNGPIEMHYRSL